MSVARSATGGVAQIFENFGIYARIYICPRTKEQSAFKRLPNLEKACTYRGIRTYFIFVILQANRNTRASNKKQNAWRELKKAQINLAFNASGAAGRFEKQWLSPPHLPLSGIRSGQRAQARVATAACGDDVATGAIG